MGLADDIRALRDRTLADLTAAYDCFTDTRTAWQIVQGAIANGHTFSIQSALTGTVTTEASLASRIQEYIDRHLTQATFQQFVASFESFFFDLLGLWLMAYPQSLMGKKVDFRVVLEAPDREEIIRVAVGRELNEVLYERPAGWFAYLDEKVKLGCPTADELERIAEVKAARNVLVHNRGIASKVYAAKAGKRARCKAGEQLDFPKPYHREAWELLRKVVADVASAAAAKA